MKSLPVLAAACVLCGASAQAADREFTEVVHVISDEFHTRPMSIPMFGLVNLVTAAVHPAGTRHIDLAIFEHLSSRDREGRKANDASGNNEAVAAGECGAAGSGRGIKNARHGNLQTHRVVSALFGRPGLDVQRSGIPGSPGRRLYGLWPPPRVTISSRASQCISSSSRTRSPDRACVPDGILSSVR